MEIQKNYLFTSFHLILDLDVGLLIKLVQNFPHIYDKDHKYFRNVALKTKTWTKIASTLKVPGKLPYHSLHMDILKFNNVPVRPIVTFFGSLLLNMSLNF